MLVLLYIHRSLPVWQPLVLISLELVSGVIHAGTLAVWTGFNHGVPSLTDRLVAFFGASTSALFFVAAAPSCLVHPPTAFLILCSALMFCLACPALPYPTLDLVLPSADARGDVFRGLEVVEQACGVGAAMMGETLAGVAAGMDTYSYREPLGVCAGEGGTVDRR